MRPPAATCKPIVLVMPLLAVASLIAGCAEKTAKPNRGAGSCPNCNIVLISLDTLRADRLGIYRHPRNTSPTIDAIARRGVVFQRAFAQSTWTLPSHFSILTGLYPSRHRVVDGNSKLGPDVPTIPELIRAQGYRTAAFTGAGYVKKNWGYRGFDVFDEVPGVVFPWDKTWASARRAVAWLEKAEQPFFLFWHTYGPHAPHVPEPDYDIFGVRDYSGPVNTIPNEDLSVCEPDLDRLCTLKHAEYFARLDALGLMTANDHDQVLAKYDAEVRNTDAVVRYLWDALGRLDLLDTTIVAITSDHGESFEPSDGLPSRRFGHTNPYYEVVRVPMIIHVPKGTTIKPPSHAVETIDLLPTLMDYAGLEPVLDIDGRSLIAAVGSDRLGSAAVSEHWAPKTGERLAVSVVHGRWHFIRWTDRESELYDLRESVAERESVAHKHPEVVETLSELIDEWQRELDVRGTALAVEHQLDETTREQLKSLGYL